MMDQIRQRWNRTRQNLKCFNTPFIIYEASLSHFSVHYNLCSFQCICHVHQADLAYCTCLLCFFVHKVVYSNFSGIFDFKSVYSFLLRITLHKYVIVLCFLIVKQNLWSVHFSGHISLLGVTRTIYIDIWITIQGTFNTKIRPPL